MIDIASAERCRRILDQADAIAEIDRRKNDALRDFYSVEERLRTENEEPSILEADPYSDECIFSFIILLINQRTFTICARRCLLLSSQQAMPRVRRPVIAGLGLLSQHL